MNDWQLLQQEFDAEIKSLPIGTKVQAKTANLGLGTIIAVENGEGLLAPKYVVRWDKTQEIGKVSSSFFTKVV